jgi:hypothetical protein
LDQALNPLNPGQAFNSLFNWGIIMQMAKSVTSISLALLLGLQPAWSQNKETGAAPKQTDTPTPKQTDTPTPTRNPGQRAPDGDSYKPPKSVVTTPKGHQPETNPGRPPAGPRGGESSSAILGGAAAAGAALALGSWIHARNKPDAKLSREGPKMPGQFNMSSFSIAAFIRADWPVVVDHVLANGAELSIVVLAEGVPPFNYRITSNTGGRQQHIFRLPSYFPAKPTRGMYTITATTGKSGIVTPVYMRLFGLAAGERAVGSVAIDQVKFGPDTIHPKQKQEALYAFHAHTEFDRVRAEFMKAVTAQGQIVSKLEDHDDIEGVHRETTPSRQWDGKKASPGEHLLQVRAWESALAKANWVIAWSADQVLVEE